MLAPSAPWSCKMVLLVEICADIKNLEETKFLLLYWNSQSSRDLTNRNLCPESSFMLITSCYFPDQLTSHFRKSNLQNTEHKACGCISRKQSFVFGMKRKKKEKRQRREQSLQQQSDAWNI